MRAYLWFPAAVAIVLVVAEILAQWMKSRSLFFPDQYPAGEWNNTVLQPRPEEVRFRTADGVELHGWFFHGETGRPVLIWFHGNAGNITGRASTACRLAARGLSVFLFDYRGYGKSEGKPSEKGLLLDSLAAYDRLAERYAPNADRFVLYGESLGGPYAAKVATLRPARCVVIENSFPSLAAMANHIYRPFPIGFLLPFSLTTSRWLRRAGLPVLVMHGRRDMTIPFELGLELYRSIPSPKELFISPDADHTEIPEVSGETYERTVIEFIERVGRASMPQRGVRG
ncbi:MAG: alpha/beta hydrolase [Thermoanaerobaculia bacterium]